MPSNCSSLLSRSGCLGLEDLRRQALAEGDRRALDGALPPLAVVGELDEVGLAVVQRDVDEVGVEGHLHLVAQALDERVQVELRRERLADVVDDGQLRGALVRLEEEAGVVEGDACARRERRHQPARRSRRRRVRGRWRWRSRPAPARRPGWARQGRTCRRPRARRWPPSASCSASVPRTSGCFVRMTCEVRPAPNANASYVIRSPASMS